MVAHVNVGGESETETDHRSAGGGAEMIVTASQDDDSDVLEPTSFNSECLGS